MQELIETGIVTLLGFVMPVEAGSFSVIVVHASLYLLVGYFFIFKPQKKKLKEFEPKAVTSVRLLYLLLLVLALGGVWLGFEIWPGMVLLIVFNRAFDGKRLGILGKIPSLKDLPMFVRAMRDVYVAFYDEYLIDKGGKPREGHFWDDVKSSARFRRAQEGSVFYIIVATALPGFVVALVNALVFVPIGVLVSGGGLSDIPRLVFGGLGTGIVVQLLLMGYALSTTAMVYGEGWIEKNPPSRKEIEQKKKGIDTYYRELMGGYGWLFVRMIILVVVGGVGSVVHVMGLW